MVLNSQGKSRTKIKDKKGTKPCAATSSAKQDKNKIKKALLGLKTA